MRDKLAVGRERAHIEAVEAVVTLDPMNPETRIFAQEFPQHRTVTLAYRDTPVYVLLR